jgi:ABC-2 type transport system ATP-binding protein
MAAAIEVAELRKTYPPDVRALDGLSMSVEPGTIFGLLGPNGAGKSTTVKVLSTLTRPDSGSARVAGIDVLADPTGVRRAIGVVGQKHGGAPEATGRENLVSQGEFYGISGRELRGRVSTSLERFGLSDAADRPVKTYSGGMQRRLDIAMGLLHRPAVLFLDEPTTGLDPEARVDMWQEIERLAAQEAMTILITTHYMDEADRLAARLAIVDRGRIVVEGTAAELKSALEGDRIEVALADDEDGGAGAQRALERVEGVGEVSVAGGILRARAGDGGAAIPAVLAALEEHGVGVASVTIARPSLDDVYLRHAGRSFSAAERDRKEVTA